MDAQTFNQSIAGRTFLIGGVAYLALSDPGA